MSENIREAQNRIRQIRQKDVEVTVLKDGLPASNVKVSFRMKRHQFLFGAVCYMYDRLPTRELRDRFTEEFVRLMNYTMIPFHWSWFEPRKGQYNEPYTTNLINWAKENNIKRKLHALIWHELCPDWITSEKEVKGRYIERISHIMANYGDHFDFIDLANETTVNDRFDNPISRWVKEYGPINMLKFGTELVRSYKPDAKLLYNDWNVHVDEYYDFLRAIRENDVDIDIIGVQSHMHVDRWSEEETLRILERTASFGWPIHFTECSVCSGTPIGKTNYAAGAINYWNETEEDLYSQAEFTRDFYTLVFSHPSVEALSWFDFTDHRWLNAPAGLVDDEVQPKPVYKALDDLINHEWHTSPDLVTGETGTCKTRLFCGNYDIIVEADGIRKTLNRDILRERFYAGGGEPVRLVIDL
ncbi:MAG TPA: endo-1,4-beta-xylanase [Candidatus Atribacteria bacterium]|nr:endo-1,4-beta-xylanase [Candidatus Atribacteria bacterium]HPT78247.1 endo-1,4-beta-xylanase [Candidatus Atribacteria bacterium]